MVRSYSMKYSKNIQKNYEVSESDLSRISSLKDVMHSYRDEFVIDVFDNFKSKFLVPDHLNNVVMMHHKEFLRTWYDKFFEGNDFRNDAVFCRSLYKAV